MVLLQEGLTGLLGFLPVPHTEWQLEVQGSKMTTLTWLKATSHVPHTAESLGTGSC